jgi:hypothetical protein
MCEFTRNRTHITTRGNHTHPPSPMTLAITSNACTPGPGLSMGPWRGIHRVRARHPCLTHADGCPHRSQGPASPPEARSPRGPEDSRLGRSQGRTPSATGWCGSGTPCLHREDSRQPQPCDMVYVTWSMWVLRMRLMRVRALGRRRRVSQ